MKTHSAVPLTMNQLLSARRRIRALSRIVISAAIGMAVVEFWPLATRIAYSDTTWTGATNQDWNTASNWSNGLPGTGNGNTLITIATGNYPILSASGSSSVDIIVGGGTSGRLDQTAGTLSTGNGNWFYLGFQGATAAYNLANTATNGGTYTSFGQGSGSLNVGGASLNGNLLVGLDNGTVSTVNINTTGTLAGAGIFLGAAGGSSGNLNLDSGAVTLSGEFQIGANFFSQGSSTSTFSMSGGTLTANIISLARGANNTAAMSGTATITGGTLNSKQWFTLGFAGSAADAATVTNNGGTVNVNTSGGGVLEMGVFDQTTNVFNQISGNVTLQNNASISFGNGGNHAGTSTFNQNGGTVTFYSDAGTTVGGTGSLNLGNGNSTGTYVYNLAGGTLTVPSIQKTAGGASGTFNFSGGTLRAAANSATFMTGLTAANVGAGGAIIDTNNFNITIGQQLLDNGGGGLTKQSAGALNLTASNTYTGATTVSGGSLVLAASADINSSSGITVNGSGAKFVALSSTAVSPTVTLTSGTVDGTGTINTVNVANSASNTIANGNGGTGTFTIGTLSFSGAGNLSLNVASNTPGLATTTLTTNAAGNVVVNATNASWSPGTYDLISYSTLGGAGFGKFQKGTIAGLSGRQSATLTNPSGFIALVIAGDNPKWTGALNSTWTTATQSSPKNWQLITSGTPTDYISGDVVLFDDSASNSTVNISAANVTPTSTTFTTNNTYTVNGLFGIAGTGSVTKNGSGSLTLNGPNTYSGGTLLNAGTLNINNASAVGTGSLTVSAGTTIDNTTGSPVTLSTNNAQTWAGDFTFGSTNDLDMGTGSITLSANVTVTANGPKAVILGGGITGAGNLVKAGGGTLTLNGNNSYAGTLTVNGGAIVLTANNSYAGTTILNGGTLTLSGSINNGHNFDLESNAGSTVNVSGTINARFFDAFGSTVNLSGAGNISINGGQFSDGTTGNFSGGTYAVNGEFWDGQSGTGTVIQTGGTVSSSSWFVIGRGATGTYSISAGSLTGATGGGNFTMASFGGASGTLNVSGTAAVSTPREFWVGEGSTGTVNQTGGSVSSGGYFVIGRNNGANGTYNLMGGTVTASTAFGFTTIGSSGGSTGILSVSGGTWNATTGGMIVGEGFGGGSPASGTLSVSGTGLVDLGTNGLQLANNAVANGAVNLDGGTIRAGSVFQGAGVGTFNFNGGLFKAAANNVNFMAGLATANIRNGGAMVDTGGFNVTIAQQLLHSIIGGDNAIDGGLSKSGAGTLTLSGANSYTGPTNVNQGTLALAISQAIANTSQVSLSGATLATTGQSQFMTGTMLRIAATSTLDFGDSMGASDNVQFSSATSADTWANGAYLRVLNWTSTTPIAGGGPDQFIAGTGGLSSSQLAHTHFSPYKTGSGAQILPSGEVVPISTAIVLKAGDINQDTHYDVADVSALMAALSDLPKYQNGQSTIRSNNSLIFDNADMLDLADLNHDSRVNNLDIQASITLLANGGASGTGGLTAVPEPGACVLMVIGGVLLAGCPFRIRR